jgi:molybdopterin synthase sulfur carrier subunit
MSITIALPGALQPYAGGSSEVTLAERCGTVAEALAALRRRHGGVMDRVTDERGELRQHVNVFVDGENIRFLDGFRTPVAESSTIVIVPAVSGG